MDKTKLAILWQSSTKNPWGKDKLNAVVLYMQKTITQTLEYNLVKIVQLYFQGDF